MAKGRSDVELTIRARNEASKAVDAVTSALASLKSTQAEVVDESRKSKTTLEEFGETIAQLNKEVGGLTAYERIVSSLQRTGQAVAKVETAIEGLIQKQASLGKEVTEAKSHLDALNIAANRLESTLLQQDAAAKTAADELRRLNTEVRETNTAYNRAGRDTTRYENQLYKMEARLAATQARHRDLTQELLRVEAPTKRLIDRFEKTDAALHKQSAAVTRLRDQYANSRRSVEELGGSLTKLNNDQAKAAQASEKASAAQAATAQKLKETKREITSATTSLNRLERSYASVAAQLEKQGTALEKSRNEMNRVQGAADEAGVAIDRIGTSIRHRLLKELAASKAQLSDYRTEWQRTTEVIRQMAASGLSAKNPTPEMRQAIEDARRAKTAYEQTRTAIHEMRNAIRAAGTDVGALTRAQKDFVDSLARIKTQSDSATSSVNRTAQGMRSTAAAARQVDIEARKAATGMGLFQARTRSAMSITQRLRGEVLALATAYLGLFGAIEQLRGVTRVFMDIESSQVRMGVATGGNMALAAREMRFVRDEARRLKIDFRLLAGEYSRFAVATRGSALEGEQTRRIFIQLSEAFRVSKLSADRMQLAFLAITQMVNKGVVSMEELRRQLGEQLYGAFQLAAKSMGITTAELDKMVSTGSLVTEEFLPKFADEIEKTFGPQLGASLETFTAELGDFQNAVIETQERVANAGFLEGLTDALQRLTAYLRSQEGMDFFTNLGVAAGRLVRALAQIPDYFQEIIFFTSVLIGLRVAAWLSTLRTRFAAAVTAMKPLPAAVKASSSGLHGMAIQMNSTVPLATRLRTSMVGLASSLHTTAQGMTVARARTVALSGAMNGLRAATAFLGGLPGLIVTGLSLALSLWLGRARDATDALVEHENQITRVIDAYSIATNRAGEWAENIRGVTLASAEKTLADLRAKYEEEMKKWARGTSGIRALQMADQQVLTEAERDFLRLRRALRQGTISAREYAEAVDSILKDSGTPERLRSTIRANADLTDSMVKVERALAEQGLAVKALGGDYSDVLPLMDKLGVSLDEIAERMGIALAPQEATVIDQWVLLGREIDAVTKMIPSFASEVKYLEGLKSINEILETARAKEGLDETSEAFQRLIELSEKAQKELAMGRVSRGLVDRIARVEIDDTGAQAQAASLAGVGKFVEDTWEEMFRRYFPDRAANLTESAMAALQSESALTKHMIELYARENAAVLQQAGVAVNDASLYLAHFLGPGGAVDVLSAAADTPLADILAEAIIDANEELMKGGTVADLISWAGEQTGISDAEMAAMQTLLDIEKRRAEEARRQAERQQEFNQRLRENAALELERLGAGKERTLEQERQLAIQKAENDARRAGVTLERSARDAILEAVTLKYEQEQREKAIAQAKKEQEEAEQRINLLQQHRRDLMEAMELALQAGSRDEYIILKDQLKDVEEQLLAAIDSQIAFWEAALGGPDGEKAAAALTALHLYRDNLTKVQQAAEITADKVGRVFGDHLISGADGFIDKIRETGDVINSLRDTFRQFAADFLAQIAKMILQQALFNALKAAAEGAGGFWGGVVSAVGAAVQHQGGIAGSGNQIRSVPAGLFANAMRYHNGGIAGLRPNEVPAVLERGEEVLPKRDPRHINNGGGMAPDMSVKVVNAIDSGSFISEGLSDTQGQKAVLNFIRANSGAVRGALGV